MVTTTENGFSHKMNKFELCRLTFMSKSWWTSYKIWIKDENQYGWPLKLLPLPPKHTHIRNPSVWLASFGYYGFHEDSESMINLYTWINFQWEVGSLSVSPWKPARGSHLHCHTSPMAGQVQVLKITFHKMLAQRHWFFNILSLFLITWYVYQ